MVLEEFLSEWRDDSDRVLVHTSGSTGVPKPMWVEKRRMEASARITCSYLGLDRGDTALLCMPLDYIAGKMMAVRAETCGLRLVSVGATGHPLADSPELAAADYRIDFAAMVPMQVCNSMDVPVECRRLADIRHLIIGGGAVDDDLAAALRSFPNAVWSTYGMTETLSHIALRRLSGPEASEWYTPFDSVEVGLNGDGCLVIDAPAVCAARLETNDLAMIAPDGRRFRIMGRRDNVICSGGIKISMEDVERRLRPHMPFLFMITRRRDAKLGEAVVMLMQSGDVATAQDVCRRVLPRYWQPRHYIPVAALPVTETGKPARKRAEEMALQERQDECPRREK